MEKFRKSFRSSFRRKNGDIPPSSKKQWPFDRESVRTNTCSFPVKYLGCVEVFEGRGLHICEEAVKIMKNSKNRPIKGSLHVSSDGLRLVDASTNGLVVDQTIEKVSFCAPDRNFHQGFSYICRDGASKRWMCHGFMAVKDTGERLSHALGCAFAICLERKQRRDRECSVTINFDSDENTFTRFGSFRHGSITERLKDPQTFKPVESKTAPGEPKPAPAEPISIAKEAASNPHAVPRPRVSNLMYERATSLRGVGRIQLAGSSSPFKRQASLRLSELPSMLERQENLIEIEDLKTDPNIRKTKISPIPTDLLGPTGETETLSPIFSPLTLSPSSVETNIFPMSVSQPSTMNHITKTVTLSSPVPQMDSVTKNHSPTVSFSSSSLSFRSHEAHSAVNSSRTPGPPAVHSFSLSTSEWEYFTSGLGKYNDTTPSFGGRYVPYSAPGPPASNRGIVYTSSVPEPPANNRGTVNSGSDPRPPASNPWDNVPDQSHIRQCDAVPIKREKHHLTGTNVFGKTESQVKGFNGKRSSFKDPFDTDWAETAGSYNSGSESSSNPFSNAGAIQTFKLQL